MQHPRAKTLSSLLREFFGLAFLAAVVLGCSPSSPEQTTTVSITSGPLIISRSPVDERNDDRPPFLLLSPNEASEYFGEFVWSVIVTNPSQPGVMHAANPQSIKYGYRLEVQYGTAPETIEENLNVLTNTLPQVSWKRQGIGYVIGSGNDLTKAQALTAQSLPPCILLSPNLDASLRFLTHLTGTKIQRTATQYVRAVIDYHPFHFHDWSSNPQQFHFRNSSDTSLVEFLKKFSAFLGCALHSTPDGFVVADASQQEIRDRVRAMVLGFRSGGSYPDPRKFTLPSPAAAELVTYLNDTDENTLQQVIISLMSLNQRVGKAQLLHIARNFHGQNTRAMAVCALAQMGSTEVLPSTYHLSNTNEDLFYALVVAMSGIPTQGGFEAQKRLIKDRQAWIRNRQAQPLRIDQLPPNLTLQELREMSEAAAAFANVFAKPRGRRQFTSHLTLTADGREALWTLTKKTGRTSGEDYLVHLKKLGNWWFVIGGWPGGWWIE